MSPAALREMAYRMCNWSAYDLIKAGVLVADSKGGIMHFTNRASWEFMPVPADAVPLRRASFCDSILIDGAKREFPSASNDI
jgi:hypothetical protein